MKQKVVANVSLKILYLEDSPHDAEIIRELLIDAGYELNMDCAMDERRFLSFLHSCTYDIILSDFQLPGYDAFAALRSCKEMCSDIPFICVSGSIGEETAIELLKQGAVDYILKDRLVRLPSAIMRALSEAKEKEARRQAEEKIRVSLAEKNVLLKEIHHRVKNNLMSIIGLIQMQERKAKNKTLSALLLELEGRVRSMALVHQSLYKSEDLARIDLQSYIETMVVQICAQFGAKRNISIRVQAIGVEMGLDIAIPCGLILNELITNAFKYAFPDGKHHAGESHCEINVSVKQDRDVCTLTVTDNGVGMPVGMNWENPETLGLQLVKMLSQQIKGTIELEWAGGTTFHLHFAHPAQDN